jgi:prepilin-type N-terminal cleavage/methylation domain-containing protein
MNRRAFTLVELLVTLTLVLLLMGLVLSAVRAAQTSQKTSATRQLIDKLNTILMQQFQSYESKAVDPIVLPAAISDLAQARAWYIRRNLITGDMPDRWTDVAAIASGTTAAYVHSVTSTVTTFPITSAQRSYRSIWNAAVAAGRTPSNTYAGAECLFMIVMRGGVADCLDCGELRAANVGDKDDDGMPEFLDAWGNPIGFILWPAALELPIGTPFFSGARVLDEPFTLNKSPRPSLGMRPLIYSAGADGEYSFDRALETGNLTAGAGPLGRNCGNWQESPTVNAAGRSAPDYRGDNITNLDAEAKR